MNHLTAMTRKHPSKPMQWLFKHHLLYPEAIFTLALDYGCGKGFDATFYGMDKYDPYYFPEIPKGTYDVITCNYVFNVMEPSDYIPVLNKIYKLLNPNGKAYIAVRRDLPKQGKAGKGCWQRYVRLPYPVIEENKYFCIYLVTKTPSNSFISKLDTLEV